MKLRPILEKYNCALFGKNNANGHPYACNRTSKQNFQRKFDRTLKSARSLWSTTTSRFVCTRFRRQPGTHHFEESMANSDSLAKQCLIWHATRKKTCRTKLHKTVTRHASKTVTHDRNIACSREVGEKMLKKYGYVFMRSHYAPEKLEVIIGRWPPPTRAGRGHRGSPSLSLPDF